MRIDSLEIKRETVRRFTKGRHIPDVFLETKFPEMKPGEGADRFIKRTVSAIRRLVRANIPREPEERIAYVAEMLGISASDIECREHDESRESDRLISATTKREHDAPHLVIRVPYPVQHQHYEHVYLHLYRKMKPSYHRTARKFRSSNDGYVPIADLESYMAEVSLLKALDHYVKEDKGRLIHALFNHYYRDGKLQLEWLSDDVAKALERYAPMYGVEDIIRKPEHVIQNSVYASYIDGTIDVMTHGSFRSPFIELAPLIISFVNDIHDVRNLVKDASIEKANYAKAFQTKKHIPESHLQKMADNRFLDIFGYVELDEDVDLERFETIEQQFVDFVEATGMPESKDHDFRIKRLGNYRAAGVYFAGFQSTVFDIRHPHAFGHEWMHQIDYTWGEDGRNVHQESRFQPLYVRYVQEVERAVQDADETDPIKKEWSGSNKYNRSYYLKKTEVFARLGEVYLSTLIEDDNSLVKTKEELKESHVHPTDPMTVRLVVDYFDELFERRILKKDQKIS